MQIDTAGLRGGAFEMLIKYTTTVARRSHGNCKTWKKKTKIKINESQERASSNHTFFAELMNDATAKSQLHQIKDVIFCYSGPRFEM